MPVYNTIRARTDYSKTPHHEYSVFVNRVCTNLTDNPHFSKPPVSLTTLRAKLDEYNSYMVMAEDGSRSALLKRNALRRELETMVTILAHYVTHASDNDRAIFDTSGFEALPTDSKPAQPLNTPYIVKITHGANSGVLKVRLPPTYRKVRKYELRYGPVGSDPESRPVMDITFFKQPATVSELSRGTEYEFQVRALGNLGLTDWSDPAIFMCT